MKFLLPLDANLECCAGKLQCSVIVVDYACNLFPIGLTNTEIMRRLIADPNDELTQQPDALEPLVRECLHRTLKETCRFAKGALSTADAATPIGTEKLYSNRTAHVFNSRRGGFLCL